MDEETKKYEYEATPVAAPPPQDESPADEKAPKDTPSSEKSLIPLPIVGKVSDHANEKKSGDSTDRDAVLAKVEMEKKLALIKAWEDSEKTKAENRASKKLSAIGAWENSQKASVEAQLKKIEEKFEKKRAECEEKMSNKAAEIHKAAEENRAMVEAKRGEDMIKVEVTAAKFRASGGTPKRLFGCFGC